METRKSSLGLIFYFITVLHTVFYVALSTAFLIKKNEHCHRKCLHVGLPFAKS